MPYVQNTRVIRLKSNVNYLEDHQQKQIILGKIDFSRDIDLLQGSKMYAIRRTICSILFVFLSTSANELDNRVKRMDVNTCFSMYSLKNEENKWNLYEAQDVYFSIYR